MVANQGIVLYFLLIWVAYESKWLIFIVSTSSSITIKGVFLYISLKGNGQDEGNFVISNHYHCSLM